MIVSRAPVRFSLGGGGTDLPSYSREHGGFLVAAAVDKFVYVCVARRFQNNIRLAYSESEIVETIGQIKHRIFKRGARDDGIQRGLELHSLADVPANTGLGSSSSFTVALLKALHAYKREYVPAEQLAREACQIEIDVLKEPIGKQDQYIAAYGGISAMTFNRDGTVDVERLPHARRSDRRARVEPHHLLHRRRAVGFVGAQGAGQDDRRQPRRGRPAHAPHQRAGARDEAHPPCRASSIRTARCFTSTGRTSASSRRT